MAKAILNTFIGVLATSAAVMTAAPAMAAQGFAESFAPDQWELYNSRPAFVGVDNSQITIGGIPLAPFNGSVDFSDAPNSLTLVGSDQSSILAEFGYDCSSAPISLIFLCDLSITSVFVPVPESARISFSWEYVTTDIDGPAFDPFGYVIDDFPFNEPQATGAFNELTDRDGDSEQSGTFVTPDAIQANQFFGFQIGTDNRGGRARVTVSDFKVIIAEPDEVPSTSVPEPASGIAIALVTGLGLRMCKKSCGDK